MTSRRNKRALDASALKPTLETGLVAFLVFAAIIGGSSAPFHPRLALLELAALPLLGVAVLRLWDRGSWPRHRFMLCLAGAVVAIPILQLIPLPPAVWLAMPGHETAGQAFTVTGLSPGWMPYSLTPDLTKNALLALTAPIAVLLATLGADRMRLSAAPWILAAIAVANVALASAQMTSGFTAFELWSGKPEFSGFFANANHLACLLVATLPFVALMIGRSLRKGPEGRGPAAGWAALASVMCVALVAVQSRLGVVLVVPVLIVGAFIARGAAGGARIGTRLYVALALVVVVATGVASVGADKVLTRFEAARGLDTRATGWRITFDVAQRHLPAGAGMGSFDRVYRSVEPLEQLSPRYFNRAHNEYLETLLEAGWAAAAVLVAFLIWLARRLWALRGVRRDRSALALGLASGAAIAVVMAFSAVEFPIRTLSVACIFALCCGLLERMATAGARRAEDDPR